jgi:hypothetical protein
MAIEMGLFVLKTKRTWWAVRFAAPSARADGKSDDNNKRKKQKGMRFMNGQVRSIKLLVEFKCRSGDDNSFNDGANYLSASVGRDSVERRRFQRHRRDISVELIPKLNQAPSGAAYSAEDVAPKRSLGCYST